MLIESVDDLESLRGDGSMLNEFGDDLASDGLDDWLLNEFDDDMDNLRGDDWLLNEFGDDLVGPMLIESVDDLESLRVDDWLSNEFADDIDNLRVDGWLLNEFADSISIEPSIPKSLRQKLNLMHSIGYFQGAEADGRLVSRELPGYLKAMKHVRDKYDFKCIPPPPIGNVRAGYNTRVAIFDSGKLGPSFRQRLTYW